MIQLRQRTEFSFRTAYGRLSEILAINTSFASAITDRNGTWGHVQWKKACEKEKVKPIYGVELAFVENMHVKEKFPVHWVTLLAKNNSGLKELYELVTLATENFYYHPRLDWSVFDDISQNIAIIVNQSSEQVGIIREGVYVAIDPTFSKQTTTKLKPVICSDNFYPRPEDKPAYQIVVGKWAESKSTPMHLVDQYEIQNETDLEIELIEEAIKNAEDLAEECNVELPIAEMVKPKVDYTLRELCENAAPKRGIDLSDPVYKDRLDRELALIAEKKYEDYFFVVADMIAFAKKNMFVGPARGSSAGSLVCYLTEITEIDPIPYDLLFERFIDINRMDYPDIDIDFPDHKRELVFDYLKKKYGSDCVARLGTVSKFKAKSTIDEVCRALNIPKWEMADLKGAIIERSGGDSRAEFCIMDTFEQLEVGKTTLAKYPELEISSTIEGHSRHTGQHAAGMLVTNDPVFNYCSVDEQTGAAMIDKYDAEDLNLLKIDALGLRTLTVIEDVLEQVNLSYDDMLNWPMDDKEAFKVINDEKFTGIFQFEGYALQSLCKQIEIVEFEDMVSITALARPGPLNSGGATEFLKRHSGHTPVAYLHELAEEITKVTYGVIVYQEQVMQIVRTIGKFSWEETSSIRKAMSKSLGEEYFDKQWQQFKKGASENGIDEEKAQEIWSKINTMGSWAFNRSHAVAYGLISYWCAALKAKWPLEFAAACLRHAKDEDQSIKILRELSNEGYEYEAFNKELSIENWSVQNGKLIGGLIGVKGIGPKMSADIMARRKEGRPLTPRHHKLMDFPVTPYDTVFECKERWGHLFENPQEYDILSKLTKLEDITDKKDRLVVFIAKLAEKNLRDHNELQNREKRGGTEMKGQTLFLNMTLEDDTDPIIATITRFDYLKWGLPIIEEGKIGDWYIWKGRIRKGFRKVYIKRWKKLTGNPKYLLPIDDGTEEI